MEKTPSIIWDRIAVNQRCAFLGTKYSAPRLKKTEGVIVNTSSSLGVAGAPESSGVLRLQKHHNWPYSGFCPRFGEKWDTLELSLPGVYRYVYAGKGVFAYW